MNKSRIEWTDRTWNPVTGCTPVSEGCQKCYASRMAKRLAGRYGYPKDEPFRVTVHEDRLSDPVDYRKSSKVFVCSMSDLFHKDVPDSTLARIINLIGGLKLLTFQVLTKRPERMRDFFRYLAPLPNLWLGVTAENQRRADERIPILLETPAAVRFVSVEPMLAEVNLWDARYPLPSGGVGSVFDWGKGVNWVIIGQETGPGARPCKPEWVESLIEQCRAAVVPVFVKGKLYEQFPIHEFPSQWPRLEPGSHTN